MDSAGKKLVADWKEKAKKVDESRKIARDFLDNLRDEVRRPLTEWEEAEEKRIAEEKAREEFELAHEEAEIKADEFLWDRSAFTPTSPTGIKLKEV